MASPKQVPKLSGKDLARFEASFIKASETECWEWIAGKRPAGYGKFWIRNNAFGAHRVAFSVNFGAVPDGYSVCHRCDNPGCVNHHHLFAATHAENMRDMAIKGRAINPRRDIFILNPESILRGERHGSSKLSALDVLEIRRLRGITPQKQIAERFKIAPGQVCRIQKRQQWAHI